jgi:hypothetical protein
MHEAQSKSQKSTKAVSAPAHSPPARGPALSPAKAQAVPAYAAWTELAPAPPLFSEAAQFKLNVSRPDDPLEREADAVAQRVTSGEASAAPPHVSALGQPADAARAPTVEEEEPEPVEGERVQRSCSACDEEAGEGEPAPDAQAQHARRECEECEENIQREPDGSDAGDSACGAAPGVGAGGSDAGVGPSDPHDGAAHGATRSQGEPLPLSLRFFFEPRFGRDLSGVRLHTGAEAASEARSLNARAYTVGQDIAFAAGQYSPETHDGRRLLAHELTHTIQQGSEASPTSALNRSTPGGGLVQRQEGARPAAAEQRRADRARADEAARLADEVYNALDGFNDVARALTALRGRDPALRDMIQQEFRLRHDGLRIQEYLKGQLSGHDLVEAFALLRSSHTNDYHTAMARALIPRGTRDDEVLRILYQLPLRGRRVLEREYNLTFAEAGEGSLERDLREDLDSIVSTWRLQKSLALLDHDLTPAEDLYFDSVGITGTHTDAVVARFQQVWDRGPAEMAKLHHDWDRYVRNRGGWLVGEPWTTLTLRQAFTDDMSYTELSGEPMLLVRAILDAYDQMRGRISAEAGRGPLNNEQIIEYERARGPLTAEQQFQREEAELRAAEGTLQAAALGAGTNEEQMYRAISALNRIWQQRIRRAQGAGDSRLAEQYQSQWDARRGRLVTRDIPGEMDEGTTEYRQARLLTLSELTPADEVYLAMNALDHERVVSLLTRYWAQGRMDELIARALQPRLGVLVRGEPPVELRPAYHVSASVSVTTGGTNFQRAQSMTREGVSDVRRGAWRLRIELQQGESESDLNRAYQFLTTPGVTPELRSAVIDSFAGGYLRDTPGEDPNRKFLNYISSRYRNSNSYWLFLDRLLPATDPSELERRARGRYAAAHTGAAGDVLTSATIIYGFLSGEETEAVTLESIQRLVTIAHATGARRSEIEAMLLMTGARDREALGQMEYRAFQARLEELRAERSAIAEAIATTVELAVDALITVATAGAAAPALFLSLSATVASMMAGMLVREALRGEDYDLVSRDNVQQLALAIAGHGFSAMGRGAFNEVISAERMARLGRAGEFLRDATAEAVNQVGVQSIAAGFEGGVPSVEGLALGALNVLGNTLGARARATLTHGISAQTPAIAQLRRMVIANVTQNVVNTTTGEMNELARTGVGNMSGPEIAQRFIGRVGAAVGRGVAGGIGDFGAQRVAAGRATRRAERELDEMARDPRRLPEGEQSVTSRRATEEREPGTITVARVNDEHAISAVRTEDGSVFIKICSEQCGRLRALLLATRGESGEHMDSDLHGALTTLMRSVGEIESRLRRDPADAEAHQLLNTLGGEINTLLARIGDARFFGVRPPDAPAPPEDAPLITEGQREALRLLNPTARARLAAASNDEIAELEPFIRANPQRANETIEVEGLDGVRDIRQGLRRLQSDLLTHAQQREALLLRIPPENVAIFMRVILDPAFTSYYHPEFYAALSRNLTALRFAEAYGAQLLLRLMQIQGTGEVENVARVTPDLIRAAPALEAARAREEAARAQAPEESAAHREPAAPGAAAPETLGFTDLRNELLNLTRRTRGRLDTLLGAPRPQPTALIAPPSRTDDDYPRWRELLREAEEFAAAHPQNPRVTDEVLRQRATLDLYLEKAERGDFRHLSPAARAAALLEFERVGREGARMMPGWMNQRRGALAEVFALRGTERPGARMIFWRGERVSSGRPARAQAEIEAARRNPTPGDRDSASIPDYSIPPVSPLGDDWSNPREWVEVKSHQLSAANGVATARNHLRDDIAQYVRNLPGPVGLSPTGHRISMHYSHDPGNPTRTDMLRVLLRDDTRVYRVKFGGTWWVRDGRGGFRPSS